MASLRLLEKIAPDYPPRFAAQVAQLEIPEAGLLLTFEGKPVAVIDASALEEDGSFSIRVRVPLKARIEYDAFLREHAAVEVVFPAGSVRTEP